MAAEDGGGTVESATRSIRGRMASLAAEHLDPPMARMLEATTEVLSAGIGVGDDPVVLSDALVDGVPGLWVLTTEQCLWEPADVLLTGFGVDRDWTDVVAVETAVRADGVAGVAVTWPDSALVFDAVGDPAWAGELAWVARQLSHLDGDGDRWCPNCRVPVGARVRDCELCSVALVPHPAPAGGVIERRLAGRAPVSPAVAQATEAALEGAFPWIAVPAVLDEVPVVVVATDEWLRAWDDGGTRRLDLALDGLDAAAEPFEDGWEVAITGADGRDVFLTGFDDASLAGEIAERIAAPARTTAETPDDRVAAPPPPVPAGPSASRAGPGDGLVRCPLCAEQIQAAAVLCRFCGARFGATAPPPPPQTATNGLAIASLVLGLLWLYWVGSVLAIVLGYIAQSQIRRSDGRQGGRGMATAGIILGWVGLAILVIGLVIVTDRA